MLLLEHLAIGIWLGREALTVINHENPRKKPYKFTVLKTSKCLKSKKIMLCGHLSAHIVLWGGQRTHGNGEVIGQLIDEKELVSLNEQGLWSLSA